MLATSAMLLLLLGCAPSTVPGPVTILIGDPSPRLSTCCAGSVPVGAQSPAGRVISLAVAPTTQGRRVYAGTLRAGVWRSDDGGATWTQLTHPQPGDDVTGCVDTTPNCGLSSLTVADLAVSPLTADLIFAATAADGRLQPLDGLYRSADGGHTWALVFQFICNGRAHSVTQVAFAPDDPTKLWAAGTCGVAFSSAAAGGPVGTSWTLVTMPDGGPVYHLAVAQQEPAGARRVYACGVDRDAATGVATKHFYYSADGGLDFAPDPAAITTLPDSACLAPTFIEAEDAAASMLAVAPGHPELVYAAAGEGGDGYAYTLSGVPDGSLNCQALLHSSCGASLWRGQYSASDPSLATGSWAQVPAPPFYGGIAGGAGVMTQPAPGGYLVIFMNTGDVSVAVGPPTADGWHRLDGSDASALFRSGTIGSDAGLSTLPDPVHVDPHAVAFTPDFALTLASGVASDPTYRHDMELASCGGGSLFLANDGGVVHSVDCGQHWQASQNLETLSAFMLAGLPQPHNPVSSLHFPALYFGTFDNAAWYSPDGGVHWGGVEAACGDCAGFWSDPLVADRLLHEGDGWSDRGMTVYVGPGGLAPDLSHALDHPCPVAAGSCSVNIGLPPTLPTSASDPASAYFLSAVDWQSGWRPLIMSRVGDRTVPLVDVVVIAPVASPKPYTPGGPVAPERVWRKQILVEGTAGWAQDGTDPLSILPAGATVIQAAGGHSDPTYYVGDHTPGQFGSVLVTRGGAVFGGAQQGNHLWRSYRPGAGAPVAGWDCIVPGPANPGSHDGLCTVSATTDAHQAWMFVSDPYDANVVYIADTDGIKISTDGGVHWSRDTSLDTWLGEHGRVGPQCVALCDLSATKVLELANVEFVPDEPGTRFAVGEAGVFFTLSGASSDSSTGETWHRLLDPSATGCLPRDTYFDTASRLGRVLYVACTGRSLLDFIGIPRPGQILQPYIMRPQPSAASANAGLATFPATVDSGVR